MTDKLLDERFSVLCEKCRVTTVPTKIQAGLGEGIQELACTTVPRVLALVC